MFAVQSALTPPPEKNASPMPNLPPRGHLWLQESQPQPLDKLHTKLPQRGVIALGKSASIKALEYSVGCGGEHAT